MAGTFTPVFDGLCPAMTGEVLRPGVQFLVFDFIASFDHTGSSAPLPQAIGR